MKTGDINFMPSLKRHVMNIRNWHWVSSAICLAGMLLFAATGITLNHAEKIPSEPVVKEWALVVPDDIRSAVFANQGFTPEFRTWYQDSTGQSLPSRMSVEWSEYELYVAMPGPGVDRWFSVDAQTGDFFMERANRGVVAYLNDLHKGRNTPFSWSLFMDVFSVACIVFSITGFLLLKRYAKGRKSTWPLIVLGIVLPVLFILPAHAKAATTLEISLPRLAVAEYHPPYVAVWVSDENRRRVKDIALWYDTDLKNNEGEKWLKDLRTWWRKGGRGLSFPIDGVSGATRRPGTEVLDVTEALSTLAPGSYQINVEAARELGGREIVRVEFTIPFSQSETVKVQGASEISFVSLKMESDK